MNEQTTKLIEQLAAKLGTTTEYLWAVLVQQAYVVGVTSILTSAIAFICTYILWRIRIVSREKLLKMSRDAYYHDDEFAWQTGVILSWIGQSIAVTVAVCGIIVAIRAFMNPEFWALNYVLGEI